MKTQTATILIMRALCVGFGTLPTLWGAAAAATSDWPQWRGPNRDGIVRGGPKLLDAWPKEGPPLLWKSDPIPTGKYGQEGGSGSPVVADGKVFLFINSHRENGKVVLSTQDLVGMGWAEGVPDELANKLEEGRKNVWNKKLTGAALDKYITDFTASLDPKLVEKFGPHIQKRLKQGQEEWAWPWVELSRWAVIRDREFPTLLTLLDQVRDEAHYQPYRSGIQTMMLERRLKSSDIVLCLDAATGRQIWEKEFSGGPSRQLCNWGASSTPAISDGKCYVAGSAGFYCLNVKDGSVVWQAKTKYSNSSPLLMNGVVYVAVPAATAYDAKTGQVLWCLTNLTMESSSFVKWTHGGTNYVIGAVQGGVYTQPSAGAYCLDAATGRGIWTAWNGGCISTPVILGDTMVLRSFAYKISPKGAERLWEKGSDGDAGSQLVYQNCVYHTGGHCYGPQLRCLDLATGETKWERGWPEVRAPSPVLAEGKIISLCDGTDGGASVILVKATSEKFEELGKFNPRAAGCASPAIAGGKLFLRLKDCVACYDIAQHGPYVDKTVVTKDKVTFVFKQAEGGLSVKDSPDGLIPGLTIADASGVSKTAKAKINGSSLAVDIAGIAFPVTISYAGTGSLVAKGEPSAAFEWKMPRLQFQQCQGNAIVLTLDGPVDRDIWKSEKTYFVSGAKVTKVEVEVTNNFIRLTTDKAWKTGDKAIVKYPTCSELPGVLTDLAFTAMPGLPVGERLLNEFLIGELREKIDFAKAFEQDNLDKNIRPVAGEKWKLCKEQGGVFDLTKHVRPLDNALVHACAYIYSGADRKVQLWAGSDDGIQIVVNGKVVHTSPTARGCTADSDKVKDVELKKGWNTVLLGISQGSAGWGFCLRIRNEQGDGAPLGVRYTAELPNER
jgi:outer membrane protein assembly factor BamB